jgi:hypothetical protein
MAHIFKIVGNNIEVREENNGKVHRYVVNPTTPLDNCPEDVKKAALKLRTPEAVAAYKANDPAPMTAMQKWKRQLKKLDAACPRYVEDLIDVIGPEKFGPPLIERYNVKKALRALKPE